MKAIQITQQLKESNPELFIAVEIGFIRQFSIVPNSFFSMNYNAGQRTDGYHLLDNEIHKQDGFLDLITPEINENQKLGEIFFNAVYNNFTYKIEEKPIEIPNTISQRQLRTQLALNGFDLSDVQAVIDSLPDPNKTIAQIAWDYSLTFVRNDALLNSIAGILGILESDLDQIFINASKL